MFGKSKQPTEEGKKMFQNLMFSTDIVKDGFDYQNNPYRADVKWLAVQLDKIEEFERDGIVYQATGIVFSPHRKSETND